ncbi:MAG: hypothetical protein ACREQN_16355 [Candidatus Binataceae bacterium]
MEPATDAPPLNRDEGHSGGEELTRGERSLLRRVSRALKFADFMAVLMVFATAFSAFATWRTATVTNLLFSVSERPYVGIERVRFDSITNKNARLMVDLRNFGKISATDGVVVTRLLVDGHPMQSGLANTVNVGMVSPNVPQLFFRFVPGNVYHAISIGSARFVVHVIVAYRGPDHREFCYNELMTYDARARAFASSGGSDRCGAAVY